MRASPQDPQKDIDLSSLPSVLKRRAGALALASVAVGALTYGALLLVPSRYSSEAQIRIGAPALGDGVRGSSASSESAALRVDKEAIASRVQELRSPDLAKQLAAELKLNLRPEFNSALDTHGLFASLLRIAGLAGPRPGETEEERVLAAYYKALQVYQVKETRVINLGFTARDSELAAKAANRLIELYQDWLRQQGVTETTDANAWLVPEIEKRTRELATAEAEVERFRSSANLFRGGGSQPSGLAEQQLTDLATELGKARAQRGEADARAQAARELMARNVPDAIPDVQKSPLIQGLIAQRVRAERDMAEAATQLLPAHPRMKQLNANVLDIRRQVQREASAIVDGLAREAKALALREEFQTRALEEAKARVGNKAGDRVRLAQLEDDAKAKRRELEGLRDRYEASRSRGSTKAVPVEVQVIATALPSSRPSWPNRPQVAALAAAATFVLGLVLLLFRVLLGGAARRAPMPVAAPAPRPGAPSGAAEIAPLAAAHSRREPSLDDAKPRAPASTGKATSHLPSPPAGAASRTASLGDVVERLIGNAAGQGGYRSLVVGASDDVDVREEAADIAAGLSAQGRQVVLVDWSLDGDGIAEALGLASTPGFTDLMEGAAAFEDVIRTLPDGDAHVVPCGTATAKGAKELDPDRVNLLLDALDEAYGDVIITGKTTAIRELFLAIEGRVDAGVVIGGASPESASGRFLGFEVTEIDVILLDQSRGTDGAKRKPTSRGKRSGADARTASAAPAV